MIGWKDIMKKSIFLDIIAIFSLIVFLFSYLNPSSYLNPIYRLGGLIVSIILIGTYVKLYIQESSREQSKTQIEKMLKPIKSRLDKIEGWKEAINHFLPNKKGVIDPITLIIILVIIILVVLYLQGKL